MAHYDQSVTKPANAIHLVETHEENPFVQFNGQYIRQNQFFNHNTCEETLTLNTSTTVPSNVFATSNSFVDIYLDNDGKIHNLKQVQLEMDVTNGDSAAWSGNPTNFWIQRADFYIGDRLVGTDYDITKYIAEYGWMNYDEISNLGPRQNISPTTYQTNATLAAGATQRFQIDITGVLRNMNLFVAGLASKVRITVYFQSIATFGISANPVISVANVKVLVEHTKCNKKQYDRQMTIYKYLGIRLKFIDYRYFKIATTNTAATENSQRISTISSLCGCLFVFCRVANPTGTGLVTFRNLDYLYMTDGSVNLVGGTSLRGTYLQQKAGRYFPSRLFTDQQIYPIVFGEDMVHTHNNNVTTGYQPIGENHLVYYTPSATNNDQAEFVALAFNTIYIKDSMIVVERTQ